MFWSKCGHPYLGRTLRRSGLVPEARRAHAGATPSPESWRRGGPARALGWITTAQAQEGHRLGGRCAAVRQPWVLSSMSRTCAGGSRRRKLRRIEDG
jgi:hypothetical protein